MHFRGQEIRLLQSTDMRWWRTTSAALLALLFVLDAYRATTQSIVHDEALSWQLYLKQPWARMFSAYDANNHVLFTILAKLSIAVFGVSEWSMRLPSLLACVLYFVVIFKLCGDLFGESPWFLAAVALLAMNPLVFDFLLAARGYGLALAFFMLALVSRRYGGVAAGLAIASNLTVLYPVVGLGVFILWKRRTEFWRFLVAAALIPAAFLAIPLSHASRDSFYVGTKSLFESFTTLAYHSLMHNTYSSWIGRHFWTIDAVLAGLAAVTIAAAAFCARRWKDPMLGLVAVVMTTALSLLVAGHYTVGMPYPIDRTGLYWIPLLELSGALILSRIRGAILFALPLLAVYAVQLPTSWYSVWKYDAGTKQAVEAIRERPVREARVGATWELEPSLNFYRDRYRLSWVAPVTREGADGNFDYYFLLPEDHRLVNRRNLRVIFNDQVSGLVVGTVR